MDHTVDIIGMTNWINANVFFTIAMRIWIPNWTMSSNTEIHTLRMLSNCSLVKPSSFIESIIPFLFKLLYNLLNEDWLNFLLLISSKIFLLNSNFSFWNNRLVICFLNFTSSKLGSWELTYTLQLRQNYHRLIF